MRRGILLVALGVLSTVAPAGMLGARPSEARPGTQHPRTVGVDYGPFRDGQRPGGPCPSQQQIDEDMELMKRMANSIRTYGVLDCGLGEKVLSAVRDTGLTLSLGLWLDSNGTTNAQEIGELQRLVDLGLPPEVVAVGVGSETLLRRDLPGSDDAAKIATLIDSINQVKAMVPGIPVTTSEPWSIWVGVVPRGTPEQLQALATAVDVIFVNIHPYWEHRCISDAVDWVMDRYSQVRDTYPGTEVVIGETGWPTGGSTLGCAVPSLENALLFLRGFPTRACQEDVGFYYFEAFDENWKPGPGVEKTWGLYKSDRTPKHSEIQTLFCSGYVLDGSGGVHPGGGAAAIENPEPPMFGWDIARDFELATVGAYVLDGFGGVHAAGGASQLASPPPPYFGFDIAYDIELPGTGVYVLDGFGGVHAVGGPPALTSPPPPYFGFDIARDMELASTGLYVLDGFGGVHPVGGAPPLDPPPPPYFGFDIARDMEMAATTGLYVLDGFGGVHAVGGAPAPASGVPYFGFDIARDLELATTGFYVLDGFGGVHAGGGAPTMIPPTPYFGFDIAKDLELQ